MSEHSFGIVMAQYKSIATITWKLDFDKSPQECLDYVKSQLEDILNCNPQGEDFADFCVQMDIAPMKTRSKLIHIATFGVDDVLNHTSIDESKKEWIVDDKSYWVKMNSQRYFVFKKSRVCTSCGLIGTQMVLDINPGDNNPHFNLYAEEDSRLVLMTKDHIVPKSKGGSNDLSNYVTMCTTCNSLKASANLNPEEVRRLRYLHRNEDKLTRQELRDLINQVRVELEKEKVENFVPVLS